MSLNMPLPIKDSYSYQNYQRQRQLTLGDLLLENRIVFLQGEIYTGNANEVVMKLLYLQSENRRKDIHFYLAVETVVKHCIEGEENPSAALLGEAKPGLTPKSRRLLSAIHLANLVRVLLHQPYGGVQGQISDIEIQANEILRYRQVLNEILAKHTTQPLDRISKDTDRDFFLGADESKKYGLVDDVLQKLPGAEEEKD